MKPSSRTPEGRPNRCPTCGHKSRIEGSWPTEDAPCPCCGHLLWLPTLANRRILIADSDGDSTELTEAYLSDMDVETMLATNAEQVLTCVERWDPAVLVLNIAIPSGFGVSRAIKNDAARRNTMVLMIGYPPRRVPLETSCNTTVELNRFAVGRDWCGKLKS